MLHQVKISVTFRLLPTLTSCLPCISSSLWDDQNSGRSSPISTNSPFWIFAASFAGTGGRLSPTYTPSGTGASSAFADGRRFVSFAAMETPDFAHCFCASDEAVGF